MHNLLLNSVVSFFDEETSYEDVTILSNTSAIINELFPDINWVGFYLYINGVLKLGPFQGKPACMEIPLDKGVCGYSARNRQSIIVNDVHKFEGHIACDTASNSELVIPIIINDELYGLLDIDSPIFNRFSDNDLSVMKKIVEHIAQLLKK